MGGKFSRLKNFVESKKRNLSSDEEDKAHNNGGISKND